VELVAVVEELRGLQEAQLLELLTLAQVVVVVILFMDLVPQMVALVF
jgi:hypothetical protein